MTHSWAAVLSMLVFLTACTMRGAAPTVRNPLEQAAAEATAIVESARATALVLQAQAQASTLIAGAAATPTSLARPTALAASPTVSPVVTLLPAPADTPLATTALVSNAVQVLSVVMAAEGGFVLVNFMAPPEVVSTWYQGSVWLEDEATGALYSEIGVVPVVGPLFGRPVDPGQPGYVMLVNAPNPLRPGAVVTVVLGDYRFEHIRIE